MSYISPADFAYHRADEIHFCYIWGSEVIWGPIIWGNFMTILPEALRVYQ